MQFIVAWRWVWLIAALLCALSFFAPMVVPYSQSILLPIGVIMWATLPLQVLGAFAMHRRHKFGWAVALAYLAALFWLILLVASGAATAAGPGGIVYGILIVLPALAIAGVLQIVSLLMFFLKESAAR